MSVQERKQRERAERERLIVATARELAEADESFQDYVIVHELLHLRYRTHGTRFQAMMTALVPDWRDLEHQSHHSTERRRIGH